jgi:hypothetical protein
MEGASMNDEIDKLGPDIDPRELLTGKKKRIPERVFIPGRKHLEGWKLVEVELIYRESGGNENPEYLPRPIERGMIAQETPNAYRIYQKRLMDSILAGIPPDKPEPASINLEATEQLIVAVLDGLDDEWFSRK